MKHKVCLYILVLLTTFISCKKSDRVVDNPQQGKISIATDESFQSVTEALTSRYMALNPATQIDMVVKKEDLAFLDLLENKVRVIVMSRELSQKEKDAYKAKIDMDLLPAKFAADAVVFVVKKDDSRDFISMEELKGELNSENKNIIFGGTNSSNLNFVAQKFGVAPSSLKFSIINGNKNVIKEINSQSGKIGVVSLNTISRPYDKESEELRNSVKILGISEGKKVFYPEVSKIRSMEYPFTRVLYFLTNEGYYGLGNGLIRFSCQQLGQIVVQKEGLQPYNIFPREVQMN